MEQLLVKLNAVGVKCLQKAEDLLDAQGLPRRKTIAAVKVLVDLALSIGMLNLRRQEQVRSRSSGRVSWGPPSSLQGEES